MSQLHIGIIGAGWWAVENDTPVLKSRPDVNVAAVCRLGPEALQRMQEQFDIPFGTENYRELLAHQKLDDVIVSSPHHLHFEHASAALERGIAALCEKPIAHGQLTHALALLFYITGLEPAEVFALMSKSKSGADLSNAIACRLTNGAIGTFGGSATMPPRSTYQVDIRIFGSAGMLLLDNRATEAGNPA